MIIYECHLWFVYTINIQKPYDIYMTTVTVDWLYKMLYH